ncbi:MAG TPA: tRNA (N6-isopentenyl adenosine(37)-C2)-methylthiotransferase MiaB [Pyrinomonadaceae bacterium]|nr:tRNA (N6-isopentenyl adenosine(37)-C2)-methylthiotransferase MiaB [Pyrinomonadaceae bacterium]
MTKGKVYIENFGCQMNVADSERASARLRAAGYELAESSHQADVLLFNTCSVRAKAEQKVFNRIGEVRKNKGGREPLIGVMGCVAQLEGEAVLESAPSVGMVVGTRATDRLPALIERALGGGGPVVDTSEREEDAGWGVSAVDRRSQHVAFVPIVEGCNKFCTYCIVPYSRGRERSRMASEIVEDVRRLRVEGYKEVQLIGQNVNSYRPKTDRGLAGYEGATPFSRLLRAVAATGMPRIKYTTSFPRDFHPDIVTAMDENENLCNWVHLPVQSGSDRILGAMRRGYKSADYVARVEAVKGARRDYSLTSDIIVGFPGETVEDFEDTLRLVERCQFDSIYIFKYSERKGTPAAKLADSLSEEEKTIRFKALEDLQKEIQQCVWGRHVGQALSVLVEGVSTRSKTDLTGHSTCNKVVNFPGEEKLIGQIVSVRIRELKSHSLYGSRV